MKVNERTGKGQAWGERNHPKPRWGKEDITPKKSLPLDGERASMASRWIAGPLPEEVAHCLTQTNDSQQLLRWCRDPERVNPPAPLLSRASGFGNVLRSHSNLMLMEARGSLSSS